MAKSKKEVGSAFNPLGMMAAQNPIRSEDIYADPSGISPESTTTAGIMREQLQYGDKASMVDAVAYSLSGGTKPANFVSRFARNAYIKINAPLAEPDFDLDKHFDELTTGISPDKWTRFSSARSLAEAWQIRDLILMDEFTDAELGRMGWKGAAAQIGTSLMDIDMIVPMAAASKAGRLARAAQVGMYAAGSNMLAEGGKAAMTDTDIDAGDVITAGVFGLVGGSVLGGLVKGDMAAVREAQATTDAVRNGNFSYKIDTPESNVVYMYQTLDAPQAPQSMLDKLKSTTSTITMDIHRTLRGEEALEKGAREFTEKAKKFNYETAEGIEFNRDPKTYENVVANTLREATKKLHVDGLFSELYDQNAPVARYIAFAMFNDPTKAKVNVNNVTHLTNQYNGLASTAGGGFRDIKTLYEQWHKAQGHGIWDSVTDRGIDGLNRDTVLEMNERWFDPDYRGEGFAADIADRLDAMAEKAGLQAKGLNGEIPVHGFEDFTPKRGYYSRIYNRNNIEAYVSNPVYKTVEEGWNGLKKLYARGIERGFARLGQTISADDAEKLAKAVIRRNKQLLTPTRDKVASMIDSDSREFSYQLLLDAGVSKQEATRLVDLLANKSAEKGMPRFAKHRIPMDLSVKDNATGLQIVDLMDTNIFNVSNKYIREMSGRSAMARWGMESADKIEDAKRALLAENKASILEAKRRVLAGENIKIPKELKSDDVDTMFSFFKGMPIGGGINPWVARAKMHTLLMTLNKNGLTQLIEFAPVIANAGLRDIMRASPLFKKFLRNSTSYPKEVLDDLRGSFGDTLFAEWNNFVNADLHEILRDPLNQNTFMAAYDSMMAKGLYNQGYWSGMYWVMRKQKEWHIAALSDKLARGARSGDFGLTEARLADIGVVGDVRKQIVDNINKYAEFDEYGSLIRLNVNRWDKASAQTLYNVLMDSSDTVIQRIAAGETNLWMHKEVGQLFMQLRSYVIGSINKQFIRNMRHLDAETVGHMTYGMAFGTLWYVTKTMTEVPDKDERAVRLQWDNIVKAALGQTTYGSSLSMAVDPLLTIFGLDEYRTFGRGGFSQTSITDVIPAASMAVSYFDTIRAVAKKLQKDEQGKPKQLTNADIGAIQSASIIGRMYGFTYLFNAFKNKSRAAKKYARERAQADAAIQDTKTDKAIKSAVEPEAQPIEQSKQTETVMSMINNEEK